MKNRTLSLLSIMTGVGVGFVTIGGLFVEFHFPGGHKILFVGLLLMIVVCLCWLLSFKSLPVRDRLVEAMKAGTEKSKIARYLYLLTIVGLCSVATACVGVIFRMLHFPGSYEVLFMGGMSFAFVALIISGLIPKFLKQTDEEDKK